MNEPRKPRVAVVFGGRSSEHGISCVTAGSVLAAIDRERYDVVPVGIATDGRWVLEADDPARLAIDGKDLPEVDGSRAMVAMLGAEGETDLVDHPGRPGAPRSSARSTSSSRCSTARGARTAPSRGCSRWPACATSAPACSPPRSAWTRPS